MLKGSKDNDYINGSAIVSLYIFMFLINFPIVLFIKTDKDPKNIAYIATQGPLMHTACDFWQMVWEQSALIIVSLSKTNEYGAMKCNQYWPSSGSELYGEYEVIFFKIK